MHVYYTTAAAAVIIALPIERAVLYNFDPEKYSKQLAVSAYMKFITVLNVKIRTY